MARRLGETLEDLIGLNTGDKALDDLVKKAIKKAQQLANEFGEEDMGKLFTAIIGFRVSKYMDVDESEERYAAKLNALYDEFIEKGVSEGKIAEMVKEITDIIKK